MGYLNPPVYPKKINVPRDRYVENQRDYWRRWACMLWWELRFWRHDEESYEEFGELCIELAKRHGWKEWNQ